MRRLFYLFIAATAVAACTTTHELKSPCAGANGSPCQTWEVNKQWT